MHIGNFFNIEELTDYIDADASSNACMVKNSLRAIAILYLPQQQFFKTFTHLSQNGV